MWLGLARWELGAQLDTMRWSDGLGVTLLPDVQVPHWGSVNGLESAARALAANDPGSD